jgi:F-type H+-transporting ATPase subunit gamma
MRAIGQTLQVTKAMNLISTAKLRKGRRILEDTEPFFNRIQKSMFDILSDAGRVRSAYFGRQGKNAAPRSAVIVVSGDRGLAGGYNANIARTVNKLCAELANPALILIGTVGNRYFLHSPYEILDNFSFKSKLPEMTDAAEIADYVISRYTAGVFDEVYIAYTYMYSAIRLVPEVQMILPLDIERMKARSRTSHLSFEHRDAHIRFEYIPSAEEVFDELVPLYIKGMVYGSLVEAYVSEQSARMAAMDEATKNAEKMLASLQIFYNRVRQTGITQEVTEIVSGSAALAE